MFAILQKVSRKQVLGSWRHTHDPPTNMLFLLNFGALVHRRQSHKNKYNTQFTKDLSNPNTIKNKRQKSKPLCFGDCKCKLARNSQSSCSIVQKKNPICRPLLIYPLTPNPQKHMLTCSAAPISFAFLIITSTKRYISPPLCLFLYQISAPAGSSCRRR